MKSLIMAMAIIAGLAAAEAQADTVTVTQTAPQTVDGENFTFTFGPPLDFVDGPDATLTLHVRGDYTLGNPFEYLTWDIDGLLGEVFKPAAEDIIASYGANDVEWTYVFELDGDLFETAIDDDELELFIDLSPNVHASWGQPFVTATITQIPEPASLALLGLGAFGWAWRSRRRRTA